LETDDDLERLREYLADIAPGPISDPADMTHLLAAAWEHLWGSTEGGMDTTKLVGRMENVRWEPPKLSFTIERHPGTGQGSTRAALQPWIVDLEKESATLQKVGRRQLRPMQPRLNVEPMAGDIVRLIISRSQDERLKWHADGSATCLSGRFCRKVQPSSRLWRLGGSGLVGH
jgi:hypothetical protein